MGEFMVEVECGDVNGGGDLGVRISSIFVVGIGSLLGALLPIILARTKHAQNDKMKLAFFIVKYFGSGVIVGTAFIHLLTPATELLQSPCLSGPITEYNWAEGIALMTVFSMFFIELIAARMEFGGDHDHADVEAVKDPARDLLDSRNKGPNAGTERIQSEYRNFDPDYDKTAESENGSGTHWVPQSSCSSTTSSAPCLQSSRLIFHGDLLNPAPENMLTQMAEVEAGQGPRGRIDSADETDTLHSNTQVGDADNIPPDNDFSYPPGGADHLGHQREHENDEDTALVAAQLTSIFILEFGVIFHSIFIGLTLAVAGSEFTILYIVLAFHQTFEGLGLGTRLALTPWPQRKWWLPWVLGTAFGFTTPIAIGIGLGVRTSFMPGSPNTMIVNGIFDSISAGILIYTGLVELMAHEFMFNEEMRKASLKTTLFAFSCMCVGAGIMALLGKWA